jgi:hypothetical protein
MPGSWCVHYVPLILPCVPSYFILFAFKSMRRLQRGEGKKLKNGPNRAQCRGQFRKQAGWTNQQAGWTSTEIVSVLLTNASTHTWTKMSLINAKAHKANLMDIEPAEKVTHCASSLEITVINESELSGDELNAYMLDLSNKTLECLCWNTQSRFIHKNIDSHSFHPIPHSRLIHDLIHSRSQLDPRLYLLSQSFDLFQ